MPQILTIMNEMTYNFNEMNQPQNFKAEGDEIIKNLKNKDGGDKYCYQFFFDTTETDEKGSFQST